MDKIIEQKKGLKKNISLIFWEELLYSFSSDG